MCQFKSAIVLREPRNKGGFALLHSFATDHHSHLIRQHNLRDDGKLRFARVEFVPEGDWSDLSKYKLRIDEEREPEWFDAEMKIAVAAKLTEIVKTMIVPEGLDYLLGGTWIIPKGRTVEVGPNTLVLVNRGTVTTNYGTVTTNDGTVTTNRGTVTTNRGTVTTNDGTVTTNYGTVTTNRGTVTTNDGTVTTNGENSWNGALGKVENGTKALAKEK